MKKKILTPSFWMAVSLGEFLTWGLWTESICCCQYCTNDTNSSVNNRLIFQPITVVCWINTEWTWSYKGSNQRSDVKIQQTHWSITITQSVMWFWKRQFTQKWTFSHRLLTLSLATKQLMVAIDFISMGKNAIEVNGYHRLFGCQHFSKYLPFVLMVTIDFPWMEKNTMEVNGYRQLFGCQHSSKYLLLCWW